MINSVGIIQAHNELSVDPAHLPRVMRSLRRVCKRVIAYDDGSTDGSAEWLASEADVLIRGERNDWHRELEHKALMLEAAKPFTPDWICWLDADEEFTPKAVKVIHEQDEAWRKAGVSGVRFKELNLWRDRLRRRIDTDYDNGWFMRLWRWNPHLRYESTERGLHRTQFPTSVSVRDIRCDVQGAFVTHYSWDSPTKIANKLIRYEAAGDTKNLPRMRDGSHVDLRDVEDGWRWTCGEEEGGPYPWSQPFMGAAHEHRIVSDLYRYEGQIRLLELGGGASTATLARRLRAGDSLFTWEPDDSPWSGVVDAALAEAAAKGIDARRLATAGDLVAATRGIAGRFTHVIVDHGDGLARDAAVRSLWDARSTALARGARIYIHDAQDHLERAGFSEIENTVDPNWITNVTTKLWVGEMPA